MIADVQALIAKGRRSLSAGRSLFDRGDHDFAVSRAYYAMFYLAEALLLSRNLAFSKHSAVIAAFGQHFVKGGAFSAERHAALRNAFDQRAVGDYDYKVAFSRDAALAVLQDAGDFITDAEAYLRRSGADAE